MKGSTEKIPENFISGIFSVMYLLASYFRYSLVRFSSVTVKVIPFSPMLSVLIFTLPFPFPLPLLT